MRKILTVLSMFVVLVLITGMTVERAHLQYEGIPIDGTLEEFVENAVNRGFKVINSTDFSDACIMESPEGYRVIVNSTPISHTVYSVFEIDGDFFRGIMTVNREVYRKRFGRIESYGDFRGCLFMYIDRRNERKYEKELKKI